MRRRTIVVATMATTTTAIAIIRTSTTIRYKIGHEVQAACLCDKINSNVMTVYLCHTFHVHRSRYGVPPLDCTVSDYVK